MMKQEIKPAIVVVGYNRLESLKRVLESVTSAHYDFGDIPLIISLDYNENNGQLIEYAEELTWKYGTKKVRTFRERQGLRSHILQCGDLALEYGAIICLEDDVVVAPDFYQYIKSAFEFYDQDDRIAGISLYSHRYNGYAKQEYEPLKSNYDAYIGQINVSWGQGWTKKQWGRFRQWYNENQNMEMVPRDDMPVQIHRWKGSWGKYFAHYMILENKYYVLPYYGFSTCFSDQGDHTGKSSLVHQVPMDMGKGTYRFPIFEAAEKYDLFFEYMGIKKYLGAEYNGKTVCSNLFGIKTVGDKYDYVLTMNKMDKKIVKSFGLKMWPMELNVIYNVPGDTIYLYDMHQDKKQNQKRKSELILGYQLRFVNWSNALKYAVQRAVFKVFQKR